MKASKEFIRTIRKDIKQFIRDCGPKELDKLAELYHRNPKHTIWNLYNSCSVGGRYKEFTKDLKDEHLWTAVRKALRLSTDFKESYGSDKKI